MKAISRATMLVATVLMVLALSATWTVAARADDAAPPPDAPTETAPVDGAAPTGGAATEVAPADVVSTEPAPIYEAPPVEAVTTEVPPTEAPTADVIATEAAPVDEVAATETAPALGTEPSTTILEQLPEGTDLALLDANGESVPLASTEAADIIASGDPMWCPAGVTPGGTGCSPNGETSFQDVITWLTSNPQHTAGVIWIEKTYVSSALTADPGVTQFTLSGGTLSTISGLSLTIQGGWNGCVPTCVSTIDTTHPSTFNGAALWITGWNGDITLSDITITGMVGTSTTALSIDTTKRVTLRRVTVGDNMGAGARIAHVGGGGGDVIVTGSQFSGNLNGDGLYVETYGNITLTDVDASDNAGDGVSLDNCVYAGSACTAPVAKFVTLNGTNIFASNGGGGLWVRSAGPITASNLKAHYNGAWGVRLRDYGAGIPITLTGLNELNYNQIGLDIDGKGAITINNVFAMGNRGRGADIWTDGIGAPVKILGTNSFYGNDSTGLDVEGMGPITVNNVTASNNGHDGVYMDNGWAGAIGGLTLTGYGTFNNNGDYGLEAKSKGAIALANLTADGNGQNHPDPTLSQYLGDGAFIENDFDSTKPQNVTLTGLNTFNNNWLDGLEIWSYGSILTNNLTAIGNGVGGYDYYGYGASLDNCFSSGSACTVTYPKPITLAGTNMFQMNNNSGLNVTSMGAISVNNILANANDWGGAYLDNQWGQPVPANLTILGYGTFTGNKSWMGLEAYSNGNISIANLTASSNSWGTVYGYEIGGAYLDVWKSAGASNITLTGTTFIENNGATADPLAQHGMGLYATADGIVSINSLQANSNDADGAGINGDIAVKLTGTNVANGNGSGGLQILSRGAVTLNNLTANWNEYGVYVDNATPIATTTPPSVTITGTNTFNSNRYEGLSIDSYGLITLNNVTASWNGSAGSAYGAYLNNAGGLVARGVTLLGINHFEANSDGGLRIIATGAVLLNGLSADNNGAGVEIDNTSLAASSASPGVTILGASHYNGNSADGLHVYTFGTITLGNVTANWNGMGLTPGSAVVLDNSDASLPRAITLSGANVFDSNYGGLYIYSKGAITLSNLSADNNTHGYGAYVESGSAPLPQNVTITGTNHFNGNWWEGIEVFSFGTISVNNLTANWNGQSGIGSGAYLDNCIFVGSACTALVPRNITLTGFNTFVENTDNGLSFDTSGALSVQRLTAAGNDYGHAGSYGGLYGYAVSGVTILCGSLSGNGNLLGGYGYYLETGSVTLQGVTTFGNSVGNFSSDPDPSIIRTCLLP